jgi:hypothetical protein
MVSLPITKRQLRVGLAALVVVAGLFISFVLGKHNFVLQLAGIVLIMVAVPVVAPRGQSRYVSVHQRERDKALAIKPWLLLVGGVLVIASVAAWIWLAADAAAGGKSGAPVVVFAFVALLCGLWWAGLFARWLQRRRDS